MYDFKIRPATIEDAAGIAYVQYHGWQETYRGIISDSYLDAMNLEERIERWKKNLQSPLGFNDVLLNGDKEIIGYVSCGKSRPNKLKCEGEIYALYLVKKYHGLGLGKQLFEHAVKRLRESDLQSICVFVLPQNPAVQFYKKFNPDMQEYELVKIGSEEHQDLGLGWSDINKFLR